jgi:hypothetical protein
VRVNESGEHYAVARVNDFAPARHVVESAHVGDAPAAYVNRGGSDSALCDDLLTSDDEIA